MSNAAVFTAGLATIVTSPEFNPALPLDQIELHENARSDLGDLTELAASIAHDGVTQAITVYREGDRYVLWMGHRRVAASRLAGKTTIPAIIQPKPTPTEFATKQLVENIQREGMDDRDIHASVVKLEALGLARKDIAKALGKSAGQVSKYFAPLSCPPEAVELFQAGKLKLGQTYTISQSPQPLETMRLILGGATRTQAARTPKKGENSTTERHEKLVIHMANAGVIVKAKKGQNPLCLADVQQLLKEATAKVDRAVAEGLGIKAASLGWADTKNKPAKVRKQRKPKTAN